jgi:hypothetical protein
MSLIEKSLEFRKNARRLVLGWFRPSILAAEHSRHELNLSLQKHWPDSPIQVYELIHENWEDKATVKPPGDDHQPDNFIVFIDPALDIDWINDSTSTDAQLQCISLAESIGAKRCGHLPREQALEFKRLIGHAIVNGIRGDAKLSCALAETAAQFIKDRTIERSRVWTLASAHSLLLGAAATAVVCSSLPLLHSLLSDAPVGIWFAAAGGLLGAYLSVLQKAGSGEWDAASGFGIHLLEVLTKFAAGTLFGCIAFAISQSVHAPASIKALTPDNASLFMFGFVAGFIERVIPKMVSTYSESFTNDEPRKVHDTKSNPNRIIQRGRPNGTTGSPN